MENPPRINWEKNNACLWKKLYRWSLRTTQKLYFPARNILGKKLRNLEERTIEVYVFYLYMDKNNKFAMLNQGNINLRVNIIVKKSKSDKILFNTRLYGLDQQFINIHKYI